MTVCQDCGAELVLLVEVIEVDIESLPDMARWEFEMDDD